MAQRVHGVIFGVDVSKATLDINEFGCEKVQRIDNQPKAIKAWLKGLPATTILALEATNVYHLALADQASEAGMTVYLVDGVRLNAYRQVVGQRAKTDRSDAQLLARFAAHEGAQLRPYQPLPPKQRQLWALLKRRAKLVAVTAEMRQSFAGIKEVRASVEATLRQLNRLATMIEKHLRQCLDALGWSEQVARLQGVDGIGPLNAMAMVATYHRGSFSNADKFVAFLGLDVRVRDSGTYKGKRKLTKKGEPECRRLLFNAARAAVKRPIFKPAYEGLLARGMSKTAAAVNISRRLARVCFALLRDGTQWNPNVD
jgi:transposase